VIGVKTDVVVVGAGPAGCLAARQLARKGLSVTIFEEHKEVGHPVHCAGLVGIHGLRQLGIQPKSHVVIRKVAQSVFHAPEGAQLIFDKGEPHAYVLHRDLLDQQLAAEAQIAGANLELETRVKQCTVSSESVRATIMHKGSKREVTTRFLVNAGGIGSRLGVHQGLPRLKPGNLLPALQYEVSNISLSPSTVHLYFDSKIANKFFTWVIPLEDNRARIGLATAHRNPREALDTFRSRHPLLTEAKIEKRFGGVVYTGGPISRTISKRFVNIGDAAGQVKATTGGGVVAGGNCAIMAAHQIAEALATGTYRHHRLGEYEKRWKRSWGRQLRLMAALRRFLNVLENRELDLVFENLRATRVRQLVETKGDIDHQGRIIVSALGSPMMWKSFLFLLFKKARYFPGLIWG
jgi:geranylgeranyl reductase family protein